jgi:hypothetical protein
MQQDKLSIIYKHIQLMYKNQISDKNTCNIWKAIKKKKKQFSIFSPNFYFNVENNKAEKQQG